MKYLLGIDYGTGSAKACITDENADICAYANIEYPIITLKPGWSEHDANRYWEIACELIQICLNKAKISPKNIMAIAVSSALPSMVMVDKQGKPVNNAYNLMDCRAIKEIEDVRAQFGEQHIFDITANRIEDQPMLLSLLWEKRNRPKDFERIYKILTIDGFITFKLTGEFTVHHAGAAFMNPGYDIRKKEFDSDMLNGLGISQDLLPALCSSTDIVGKVTVKAAAESGLTQGTSVAAGR